MKKNVSFLTVLFLAITYFFVFINDADAYYFGEVMATFKEVEAKSNGDGYMPSDREYQCVEYVKRFYREAFGCDLSSYIGVAQNYYKKYYDDDFAYIQNSGLVRYDNGGVFVPKAGDIIVYGNENNGIGHVGVSMLANTTQTNTIEQNWSTNGLANLPATTSGSNYTLLDRGNYKILGWLHMPVGEFSDGWHFDYDRQYSDTYHNLKNSRPFVVCYKNNGGHDVLGSPTSKVYEFPSFSNPYQFYPYSSMRKAWIQDFQQGSSAYSLVVNEYVINVDKGYFGAAYPIGGQIRTYWKNHYWELGYPVSNEYYYNPSQTCPPEFTVQWFERLDEEYYVVIYNNLTGQIWYESKLSTNIPMPDLSDFVEQASSYYYVPEGVGGGGDVNTNYTIERTTMCKGIQSSSPWNPVDETTEFYNTDNFAFSWIKILNLYESLNVEFKWYNPAGTFVTGWDYTIPAPQTEGWDYWTWYTVWCWLDVSNIDYYGQYMVDIYINGEKVSRDFFDITINLEAPQNLTGTFSEEELSVSLQWSAVSNATSYKIYRDGSEIATTSSSNYIDNEEELYTEHTYQVRAAKGNRNSSYSNAITIQAGVEPITGEPIIEDWEGGTVDGWVGSFLYGLRQESYGGNPNGCLWMFGHGTSGITNLSSKYQGNLATKGIRKFSFDIKVESYGSMYMVTPAFFTPGSMSGWGHAFSVTAPVDTWVTYSCDFDPNWTDAQAQSAGWSKGYDAQSFSTTMSNLSGVGFWAYTHVWDYYTIRIDNFNLLVN